MKGAGLAFPPFLSKFVPDRSHRAKKPARSNTRTDRMALSCNEVSKKALKILVKMYLTYM